MADKKTAAKMTFEEQSAYERRLQLEGMRNPEGFELPDGRTLADALKDEREKHVAEGRKQAELDMEAMRKQSSATLVEGRPARAMVADGGGVISTVGASAEPAGAEGEARKVEVLSPDFPHFEQLSAAGFKTLAELREAPDERLLGVEGVGEARLKEIRAALK